MILAGERPFDGPVTLTADTAVTFGDIAGASQPNSPAVTSGAWSWTTTSGWPGRSRTVRDLLAGR